MSLLFLIAGFVVLVVGLGMITDASVRMRGGISRPPERKRSGKLLLVGLVIGLTGFALLLYGIATQVQP